MSTICSVGIDFGNLNTVMATFQVNESDPRKSMPFIISDRNGEKHPSSEVLFDKGNRLTATAAKLLSDKNPSCCAKFIKSSIKRSYDDLTEETKLMIPAMQKDEHGDIEYCVDIENEKEHFWPSHLAGMYIADRVEDIKKDRGTDKLNLVISIPKYYNKEQILDFQAGLNTTGVTNYILIEEPDAVAIEYGYYANIENRFESAPLTVLFVGVGYAASQCFVVQYTKNHFKILHYESSTEVSSSKLDDILYQLVLESYEDAKNDDDPDITNDAKVHFRLFNNVQKAKENLSQDCMDYAAVMVPVNQYGDDIYTEVIYDDYKNQIDDTNMCTEFRTMVEACFNAIGDTKIDCIEVCDSGAFVRSFKEVTEEVAQEHGCDIS